MCTSAKRQEPCVYCVQLLMTVVLPNCEHTNTPTHSTVMLNTGMSVFSVQNFASKIYS
jgi:hypothetical protein